ncbi:hypothetical protein R0J90_15985, partial [Micrococcus sp. SIMBA_144]
VASAADDRPAPLLEATRRLAGACALDPETDLGWGVPRVPAAAVIGIDGPPAHVLRERTRTGLLARYPHLHTGGGPPGTSQAARDLQGRAEH